MSTVNYRNQLHHRVHQHARHHVHRLRGKSEAHRKAVAFTFAFVVTFVVFMLWYFLSLPKILETYQVTKSENERVGDNPLDKLTGIFTGQEPDTDPNNIEITQ